jgi:ferredoxin
LNAPASDSRIDVRIEPSGLVLRVATSERVLDILDEAPEAGLPLACRAGNCGACLLIVREGAELLDPPDLAERETLTAFGGAPPGERLGCQLRVAAGVSGRIVLEVRAASERAEAIDRLE